MAKEEDYLDLVIAGELVVQWLEVINTSARLERVAEAAQKLREGVERSEAYIEEALEENAVPILEKFVHRCCEDWKNVREDVEKIITILQDHEQTKGSIVELKYGVYEIRIRQGALLDGLGARLWNVAHSLNNFLVKNVDFDNVEKILELGSGCGSTGILTAKISPSSTVYLTDCVPSVLENLRASCRLNIPKSDGSLELECVIEQMNDDLIESTTQEGESLDGMDDLLSNEISWEVSNMSIRYFNWERDSHDQISERRVQLDEEWKQGGMKQLLDTDGKFDIILASEVLYEELHAILVASVLKKRLKKGGYSLIAGAVRDQSIYDSFMHQCETQGMNVQSEKLINGEENTIEYEGGIILLRITHQQ